ncbi:MAG: glycosyltransferase family 4 protein [Cyclobacteriaceae bacterium]
MKKVLMFGWEYPPEISGGLGIATHGLLLGLAKQKTDVTFVLPSINKKPKTSWEIINASDVGIKAGEIIEEEYWESISFIEIGTALMPYVSTNDYRKLVEKKKSGITKKIKILKETLELNGGYGENLMTEVSRFAMVATELVSKKNYDLVHGHDWMTFPAALAAGAKANLPVVLHVHSTEIERSYPDLNQSIYELEHKSLAKADHIVAVSQLTKNVLIEHYGISEESITVVHNSFSPEFKKPLTKRVYPSAKPTVTFLGRFAKQKAPSLFVDVASTLSDRNPDYRFVMAGDGYLLPEIKDKVKRMNLNSKFKFPGFISASKVKRLFEGSDVFLMPSGMEPFGMVALEAAYCGVPVILSNQTGAKEVLKSAITQNCWETYNLANAVENLVNNPDSTKAYIKQLKKEASRSWDTAAKETLKIYKKL